jgi:seryl-tRNA synthetase
MTRISKHGFAGAVGGLLAALIASSALAQQQDAAERYARTVREANITARYNTHIEQQIRSQEAEIAALEQQVAGLDAVAVDVQALLQRMFDSLEQFVSADVPFAAEERAQRVERLRDLMASVDATASEKFRRLVEAYQIELEYGRTMTAYRQTLPDGREADIVRLGHVSLLYRTTDGLEAGHWDNVQEKWVPDPGLNRAIEEAVGIAKEERAPDLITVPVPTPQGERS